MCISEVAKKENINWVTSRNALEFLVKLGLADEKKEIIDGRYQRTFKGIRRGD